MNVKGGSEIAVCVTHV